MKLKGINDAQDKIDLIISKDKNAIISGISSDVPIVQINAVIAGAQMHLKENTYIDGLKRLKGSMITFFGMPMSAFVTAALDVLGVEAYNGDDEFIKRLIDAELQF